MVIDLTPVKPAKNKFLRIFGCIFRQKAKLKRCPIPLNLSGKNVLITGGIAGVGEFISRALVKAGANVTSISRGVSNENKSIENVNAIFGDLSDPKSVKMAVDELGRSKFDIVICNAGIVLDNFQITAYGQEKTFSVNVFGHHLLYRLLIERAMLSNDARIIMTSGEAYVSHNDKIPNESNYNGMQVYANSKLGNLWQTMELTKRYPTIKSLAIHPGVIASGFVGSSKTGFLHWLRCKLLISEEEGAQAALIASTQDLPNGTYWHNTLGIVDLSNDDIAQNAIKSLQQWQELEKLAAPWL
jgi:NAD(P)-dependent dehydrogenase (short-subunit alcohol dehydrogenase family)